MGVVNTYFKYRKADTSGDFTNFYDFTSITVRKNMEAKTNTVKITLPNKFAKYSGKYGIEFKEEDEIYLYSHWGEIVEASHLIMGLTVKELSFKSSGKKRELVLTCMDRTYQLLNKIYMGAGSGIRISDGLNTPEVIKKIVDDVSTLENRDNLIGTDTYIETTPANIAAGATAFDDINISLYNKNAYEWILKLSQDPYTRYDTGTKSDRAFIFWIDEDNEFHWKYPGQTASATINLDEIKCSTISLKKSIFDVVNLVFFNAGNDPAGNGISWYKYDETSKNPELRSKQHPMTEIARDLQQAEKDFATAAGTPFTGEYPDFGTYGNYTTSWNEVCTNNADYLGSIGTGDLSNGSGFRNEAAKKGVNAALAIIKGFGDLRWRGTVQMKGRVTYNVGDLLAVTWSDANMVKHKLRCKGVEHQVNNKGWTTTLTLEEDAKALTS